MHSLFGSGHKIRIHFLFDWMLNYQNTAHANTVHSFGDWNIYLYIYIGK